MQVNLFGVIFAAIAPGIANDMSRFKLRFRIFLRKTRNWLAGFSFRTGLIVLGICALF